MFKRQFYAVDHADNDDASSSDSSVNTDSDDDSAHDQDEDASSPEEATPGSSDSDSDGDEEPPETESEDEEWNTFRDRNVKVVQSIDSSHFLLKKPTATTEAAEGDSAEHEAAAESGGDRVVLRVGGVLKCRYCVKILCLSDESMKAHLLSKRHARSLKQLANGKLKVQIDSDGNEEEEGETHAERLERIRSIAQEKVVPLKRKAKAGRQRQRKRAKQKLGKAERALQKSAKQKVDDEK